MPRESRLFLRLGLAAGALVHLTMGETGSVIAVCAQEWTGDGFTRTRCQAEACACSQSFRGADGPRGFWGAPRALGVWAPAVAPRTGLGKVAAVTMGLALASPIPVA